MGGINSLSGLNKVNVDYRPQVEPDAPNAGNGPQPQQGEDIIEVNGPAPANAKSLVRQLDALLLNAASKSVSASAAEKMDEIDEKLPSNILTEEETEELDRLAKDATDKLKALDGFSGRELAKALMTKSGELVWRKGFFGGMGRVATAVKAAVEAQEALSAALGKLNERIAQDDDVSVEMQEAFTELQFQCDRRATEIYSIIVRMHDLAQQDVASGAINDDPQVKAYLAATFKELMPREAILMHGTAEALETMKKQFADGMRPLAAKLDAFASDPEKTLSAAEVAELDAAMATMKNTLADVRRNGIEIRHPGKNQNQGDNVIKLVGEEDEAGDFTVSHTEVDKTLLDEMEKVLAAAKDEIDNAKQESVARARRAFHGDVRKTLDLDRLPDGRNVMDGGGKDNPVISQFVNAAANLADLLAQFGNETRPMAEFDAAFSACVKGFPEAATLQAEMENAGFDKTVAKNFCKALLGLELVAAQFKELMRTGENLKASAADSALVAEDVRKIMLGEERLSVYIEAKSRGFRRGDVDPETDESNIASSRRLGSGNAGTTYLLTTKSGGEVVFKPELGGRLGLNGLRLGETGGYLETQTTANLNLATRQTAKFFGCEDLVVKCSVGVHDGQFGTFMEKAGGYTGKQFCNMASEGGSGIAPLDLKDAIADKAERLRVLGQIARKLNQLMWLDIITGQGDRHWENYFVYIDEITHDVTVKAIDNDASFSAVRVGVQKYVLTADMAQSFIDNLSDVSSAIHKADAEAEFRNRLLKDPGLAIDHARRTVTIDLSKAASPELGMAVDVTIGSKCIAMPLEIDKDFYDKLIEMGQNPDKKREYLDSIAPRISQESLRAAEQRLDDAIAHARKLASEGKVYSGEHWTNPAILGQMPKMMRGVKIEKSDGTTVAAGKKIPVVKDYVENNTPSFFTREDFHALFA